MARRRRSPRGDRVIEALDSPPTAPDRVTQLVATKPTSHDRVRKALQVLQADGATRPTGSGSLVATMFQPQDSTVADTTTQLPPASHRRTAGGRACRRAAAAAQRPHQARRASRRKRRSMPLDWPRRPADCSGPCKSNSSKAST